MPDTHTRTQHTPGPWIEDDGFVYGADGFKIADPRCEEPTPDNIATMDANARLIEAAPNLLAACELMEQAETNADAAQAWLAIRAAIRKARGEE